MAELPKVTVATVEDEPALMEMCARLNKENGLFKYSPDKVRKLMRYCYARTSDKEPPTLVGVIRNKSGVLEASTCLQTSEFYYTEDWHLGELWTYVEPEYRNSRNAEALIEFGKACAVKMNLPYITGIITNKAMAGKARLYRRLLGHAVGAFFLHNAKWEMEPMQDYSELIQRVRKYARECSDGKDVNIHVVRKELAPLLRETADAISSEQSLWSNYKHKKTAT
jgi:hypothetical protein